MKKSFAHLLTPFMFIFQLTVYPQDNGMIEGRVFNAKNNEPVEFASLAIFGTAIGSISDLDGKFLFTGVKPGYVEIRVSSVGFEPYVSGPILVTNANKAFIDIPLQEKKVAIDEVIIKASPFRRNEESPLSLRRIDLVEIEKNPGGNRDISKIIQSYPGVASTPAYRNDIIVRGGGANENRFYLDGVEIPNLNHFATQGASGGPVGIINVDFIREVEFYSGAFPADRGNALSSILEMKQVDGNKDKLKIKSSLGASDLALTMDGPITDKASFIISARRSYLQFIFSALGLPFLPTYNDFQFKIKIKIDTKNEVTLIGLGALDRSALNLKANKTEEQKYILGFLPVNEQWNYTIGAVYKHFRNNGYDTWVVSRNHLNNRSYKYIDNESDSLKILDYVSNETENKFRYEKNYRFTNGVKLNFGTNLENGIYDNRTLNTIVVDGIPVRINYSSTLDLFKFGFFGHVTESFAGDRLTLSFGIRTDGNNYSKNMSNPLNQLSPRFSASYLLSRGLFLNVNAGRYFQIPPYTMLGYRDSTQILINKENGLKYIQADHLVAGIEWQPDENSSLSLEGFYKYYKDYPFSINDSISLSSKGADFGTFGDEAVKSASNGRAYGMELLYRDKDFFGGNLVVSYTLVRSESEALKAAIRSREEWVPTIWDNRHIINITGIREFKKNWRLGMKWRFVGGAPYTPFDKETSSLIEVWNARGMGIFNYSEFNQLRLKSFHQLDLRVDKEWFLNKISINLYMDVQNIYNFSPEQQKVLVIDSNVPQPDPADNSRYQLKELGLTGGTILPTVGIIIQL